MKKYFISLFALAALAACSKSEEPNVNPNPNPSENLVPILPTAGIQMIMDTKAPIAGPTFAEGSGVFNVVAYSGKAVPTTDWSAPYIDNVAMDNQGGKISFSSMQYYPANGDNVYFYAWTPAGGTYVKGTVDAAPKATFTIDGTQDIMAAQVTTGFNKASGSQPAFQFQHKLMQVSFQVVKESSFTEPVLVQSIDIKNVATSATLDIATGVLSFDAKDKKITIDPNTDVSVDASAVTVGDPVMFQPGKTFDITVKTTVASFDATITLSDDGVASHSYVVTLTFKGVGLTPTASIGSWAGGGTGDGSLQ